MDSAGLAAFLARVAADTAPGDRRGATLRVLSDRRMRELNRRFRGTDAATDVLAFPAESGDGDGAGRPVAAAGGVGVGEEPYLGDLAVSAETAGRQAAERGETLDRELRVLALHGYLHLLGYDHETDRGEMDRLERLLRRRHGLAPGAAAREANGPPAGTGADGRRVGASAAGAAAGAGAR